MNTIFFELITCLDHAFIDDLGRIRGGSFMVSVNVSSPTLDPNDSTVVDFSSGKKLMKAAIDDINFGYDHKIWFIPGFSKGELSINDDFVSIDTPAVKMILPKTALRVFDLAKNYEDINLELDQFLNNQLPDFQFQTYLTQEISNPNVSYFRYAHGLKTSTKSIGCQNIAHGHLSWISMPDNPILQEDIALEMNETYWVWRENVIAEDDQYITLSYTTAERGYFELTLNKAMMKVQVIETESTIEYISQFVKNKYLQSQANTFWISEGLQKGAVVLNN